MNDLDLDAIRERLANATPGPWKPLDRRRAPLKNVIVVAGSREICGMSDVHQRDYLGGFCGDHEAANAIDAVGLANADFIANAPTDIAALLAEVDRLRGLLARSGTPASGISDTDTKGETTCTSYHEDPAAFKTLRERGL